MCVEGKSEVATSPAGKIIPYEVEEDDEIKKSKASTLILSVEDVFDRVKSKVRPLAGRTLFFSRHGESEYNVEERIGGNPPLTKRGEQFAKAFGEYINGLDLPNVLIWTSSLQRTIQTAAHIKGPREQTPFLDEVKSGFLDGLTYKEVETQYPKEWEDREKDKLRYRYPGGESYVDCCSRVSPVLIEMESYDNLIIVAHQAILRCVFGYLLDKPMETIPYIKIPQHTIMQVTFDGEENIVDFIRMPVDHIEQGVTVASTEDQKKVTNKIERGSKL